MAVTGADFSGGGDRAQATVVALFVAPAAGEAMVAVDEVLAVAGRGLEGDRYFLGRGSFSRWPGEGRAVTLIEQESLDQVEAAAGTSLAGGRSRRNIVTAGVALGSLVGKSFRIGGALLRGTRACTPCRYLERRTGPGVYEAMRGRGGLRADVVRGGVVRVGDRIAALASSSGAADAATAAELNPLPADPHRDRRG